MISDEPTGYEDEPRETFDQLPADLHSFLYHHERLNHDLSAEINYYQAQLGDGCKKVLELGCGTCLLSSKLEELGFTPIGIDIDRAMLKNAEPAVRGSLVQMDMLALAFHPCFEAALIAQNTLNLLVDANSIHHCLRGIGEILIPGGRVLAHVHCCEKDRDNRDNRQLQFMMFDHPDGGRIIKESIRFFDIEQQAVILEQRYKIRRFDSAFPDRNYRTSTTLAALTRRDWVEIFNGAGFSIESTCSDFSGASRTESSTLLLIGRLIRP